MRSAMRHLPALSWLATALGGAAIALAQPASVSPRPWNEYRVILWVGDTASRHPDRFPLFLERLRELGADTGMVHGGGGDPQHYLAHQTPYYVENIVNRGLCLKWNSPVRDWDSFVTAWAKGGRPESAFLRPYCLDDPDWQAMALDQMRAAARKHAPHRPLAHDIRDELSVTISANPFDYDYSPRALEGFRAWLQSQYPSLEKLNREWQTPFPTWDDVRPFSTDQIKNRMASGDSLPRGQPDWGAVQRLTLDPGAARQNPARWNFAPWADFRTYMDVSLARTLDRLRNAARDIDPLTPVGIEGTQMPHAFGGYDLWRLAQAVDWIEPYDIGNAREIFGSFMPGKPILSTVFEKDTRTASRRLWHLLLEGDRGCIVWWSEDCLDWTQPDWPLTAKARALAPVFSELRQPIARLFLRAMRVRDPIYLLYSQPSIQVDWLLESTVDGSTWHRRFSSYEADHNRMARLRNAWLKGFQDLGYSPQFLSSAQLESRAFQQDEHFVLVLSQAWALSDREINTIQRLMQEPHGNAIRRVFADATPGLFTEHGRLRESNPLESHFPWAGATPTLHAWTDPAQRATSARIDLARFPADRLSTNPPPASLPEFLLASGLPSLETRDPAWNSAHRIRLHRFRLGAARLFAVERGVDYHMSEDLRQAGGNEALEKPVTVTLRFGSGHLYDLRRQTYLGHNLDHTFVLDPWQPALFALLAERQPAENLVRNLDAAH
ncbi:MAG TPA: beta-galactosidase [Verrucomicrobiota bacterium]|nr:beta-galactosidase [Verrucomicrobiota bacterium]